MVPRRVTCVLRVLALGVVLLNASACATLNGAGDPRDPLEGINRPIYSFNEFMDAHLFDPLGRAYKAVLPDIVDRGITNIFNNINDVSVIANDILLLKLDQAVSDIARVVFNSTIGIGGFFDVSSSMGLPKHNEDLGQTLAHWGIGPGPYLVAPLLGPTTVRDAVGYGVQGAFLNPLGYVDPVSAQAGLMTTQFVDIKADLLSAKQLLGEAALDPYEFTKNAYFERRESRIRGGAFSDGEFPSD